VFSLVYGSRIPPRPRKCQAITRLRTRTSIHHSHVKSHLKMVPNPAPPPSATITEPLPPLTRSTTLPLYSYRPITTDRTLLAPEDAIYNGSPPRKQSPAVAKLAKDLRMTNATNGTTRASGRTRHKDRTRSGSRRRKGTWKKLLWVKQSCMFYERIQWTLLTHERPR
jgi:phosphatidylinositol N-acetylglucosaminyltransferase subunit C